MGLLGGIIAALVGVIAIASFLISYGVWKGRTDSAVEQLDKRLERFESMHRALGGKLDTTREEVVVTRTKLESITEEHDT
jgi:hypothetical protein